MQPRGPSGALLAVFLVATASCLPTKAFAQGFFQSLFGGSAPQQSAPPPAPRAIAPAPPAGFGHRAPVFNPHQQRTSDADEPREQGGTFRTMCVRLCDGYYWPISQSVRRSSFYRDARACKASCGQEARLFFHSSSSGDASEMVDQQGRPYTSLPTAFLHRKRLVAGCQCKPEPWSEAELSRHRLYAFNELRERLKQEGAQPAIASGSDAPVPEVVSGKPVSVAVLGDRPSPAGPSSSVQQPASPVTESVPTTASEPALAPEPAPAAELPSARPTVAAEVGVPLPLSAAASRRPRVEKAAIAARPKPATIAPARKTQSPVRHAAASNLGAPAPQKRWPGD